MMECSCQVEGFLDPRCFGRGMCGLENNMSGEPKMTVELNIPATAAERIAAAKPTPDQERTLLLTVARVLRAHVNDHLHDPDFSEIDQDWLDLNEALAPFEPTGEPFSTLIGCDPMEEGFRPVAPKCNHWPGQKRCDVCGMGSEK